MILDVLKPRRHYGHALVPQRQRPRPLPLLPRFAFFFLPSGSSARVIAAVRLAMLGILMRFRPLRAMSSAAATNATSMLAGATATATATATAAGAGAGAGAGEEEEEEEEEDDDEEEEDE